MVSARRCKEKGNRALQSIRPMGEYVHALRLVSKLPELRAGYTNLHLQQSCKQVEPESKPKNNPIK